MLDEDAVVDLRRAYAAYVEDGGHIGPVAVDDFPTDMLRLLEAGDVMWEAVRTSMDWVQTVATEQARAACLKSLSQVQIAPPVWRPGKIVCVGLNYHDHCREQGLEVPKIPVLFAKFPSALIGPEESITWPTEASSQVDYEAELAVVIGRTARNIEVHEANDYIAGYTVLNDVSARDVQFAVGQWTWGKSFDSFCPLGPYLVTPDEVGDPQQLRIRCWLNGELVQDSNTKEMIFKISDLLSTLSKTFTLLPGDIIGTGTPDGVGVFRKPPVFLKRGDTVEIEIEKVGRLRNPVV